MNISDIYSKKKPVFSLEIFPPKTDLSTESIYGVVENLAELHPDFISVTCSAGGSGGDNDKTAVIASEIQKRYGVTAMAHVTCIGSSVSAMTERAEKLSKLGVRNVLALRGDYPKDSPREEHADRDFTYASDLARALRDFGKGFCVGGACYPEIHPESRILRDGGESDLKALRAKRDAGVSFLLTQLFFDNDVFFDFLKRVRGAGITLPVSAGIMPVTNAAQIRRMVSMCGASIPSNLAALIHRFGESPDDMRKAGLDYACRQVRELLEKGADGIHLYTMNKPDAARYIYAEFMKE